MPRWEDQSRLSAAASSGSAVVIACNTADKPTFVAGRQVILWRDANTWEVTTATAVASGSVTADLASSWGAGTIIAPVMPGRLVLPLALSHWVPTSGALQCAIDFDLTDIAGVGTGGTGTTGTAAAIVVGDTAVGKASRGAITATVTDAAGNRLPGTGIVWTSSDATNAPVYATSDPSVAMVGNPNGLLVNKTITATLGSTQRHRHRVPPRMTTTFAGYDCLTIPPNAVPAWDSSTTRTVDRAENAQGNVVTSTRADLSRDTRTLTWNCATRADLTALRAVLDARYGSLMPLWIPTYQRDVNVTAINFAGDLTGSREPRRSAWRRWSIRRSRGSSGRRSAPGVGRCTSGE
jgi:hypothetical protein